MEKVIVKYVTNGQQCGYTLPHFEYFDTEADFKSWFAEMKQKLGDMFQVWGWDIREITPLRRIRGISSEYTEGSTDAEILGMRY